MAYKMLSINNTSKWAMSILLLSVGIGIYILFRPQNILVFGLLDDLGLMPIVDSLRMHTSGIMLPSFVINSVPSGLWTASYLMAMYLTTTGASRKQKLVLSLPLPITAIILEFFQLFGWCSGTFDFYDLLCYMIPLIVFIKSI
jgi:hypothetical protein